MEILKPGKYYHIYNRGNNSEDLFCTSGNYSYFLRLYDKYIDPVAETYAWCLMPNHFHLLVRIKEAKDKDLTGFNPSQHFSNLFNAYARAFNKQQNRTGALFSRPFNRKEVDSDRYFRQLVHYIHNNPVHHGFTSNFKDYPWSSYGTVLSQKPTKLQRTKLIGWFDDVPNFIEIHNRKQEYELIQHLIIEE